MTSQTASLPTVENCSASTQLCSPSESLPTESRPRATLVPRADIFETASDIVVLADLPGVEENSVDITVEKNILTIKGHSQIEPPPGMTLSYSEFNLGDYQRRFTLPNEIDKDGISASMKNGVLKLVLPKSSVAQVRKIAVKSE